MADSNEFCNARLGGDWVEMAIEEVLLMDPRPVLRCHECGGRVRAHKEANNGMRPHFEHFEKHNGCSLKSGFSGIKTPHPDTLA